MPSKEDLIAQLQNLLPATKRLMHTRSHALLKQYELSNAEFELFFALHCSEELPSSKDLAASMRLSPGAISQLVDKLVDTGYVQRLPDENDRRIIRLSLTATGKRIAKEIQQNKQVFLSHVLSELNQEELAAMISAHHKIIDKLQKEV